LALLEKQGLSIEEAARRAGVGRSTLSKAVRGQEARQAGWWTALGASFSLSYDEAIARCDPSHVNHGGAAMWKARV
jgi:transcriptional regulator with XRE-family HTH domain